MASNRQIQPESEAVTRSAGRLGGDAGDPNRPGHGSRSPNRSRWGRRSPSRPLGRRRGEGRGRSQGRGRSGGRGRCERRRGPVRTASVETDRHTTMPGGPDVVSAPTPAIRSQQPAGLTEWRWTASRTDARGRRTMTVTTSGSRPFDGWHQQKKRNGGGGQNEHPPRRTPDDRSRWAALGPRAHRRLSEPEPATIRPAPSHRRRPDE